MSTTQTFLRSKLFGGKEKIEGTELFSGMTFEEFGSKKETKIRGLDNSGAMRTSKPIGEAIAFSQKEGIEIYQISEERQYFAVDTTTEEVAYYDFISQNFMSNNIYSRLFLLGYMAIKIFEGDREIIENFMQLNFSEQILYSWQNQHLLTLIDSIATEIDIDFRKNKVEIKTDEDDRLSQILNKWECSTEKVLDITSAIKRDYKQENIFFKKMNPNTTIAKWELNYEGFENLDEGYAAKEFIASKESYEMYSPEEISSMPLILRDGYEIAKKSFEEGKDFISNEVWTLIQGIKEGDVKSVNFTGPAGVGKTTNMRQIAGALGLPYVLIEGSENLEESELLGTREVLEENGTSITGWRDGPVTTIIRYGGFLFIDEVNAIPAGVLIKLNSILDGSKYLILPNGEGVPVHPNFVFGEAMNVGSAYRGTDIMNLSHLDRMDEILKIADKTVKEEAAIIADATGYKNLENIEMMCEIKKFILLKIKEEGDESEQVCSIRRLICWARKAKRTGEFIESSLTTIISHLSVYDDSIDCLTTNNVRESEGISKIVLEMIIEKMSKLKY